VSNPLKAAAKGIAFVGKKVGAGLKWYATWGSRDPERKLQDADYEKYLERIGDPEAQPAPKDEAK
jgi:hypothetical protein